MNIIIPVYADRFRLVKDLPVHSQYMIDRDVTHLPAGTVIAIDRVSVNKQSALTSLISIKVLASPEPRVAMKKYGGTYEGGYSFHMTVEALRKLEVELVEDMK